MAVSSEEETSKEDLAAWLSGGRHDILQAIRFHDGRANTSEIKDYSGVAHGSYDHHVSLLLNPPESLRAGLDWLGDEGLIEETDRVNVGTPVPARQFGLTEAGEKAFGMVIDDVSIRASDVRDLQQRVKELEAELQAEREEQSRRIEELEQENETLKESFNHMANVVENLIEENDLTQSM